MITPITIWLAVLSNFAVSDIEVACWMGWVGWNIYGKFQLPKLKLYPGLQVVQIEESVIVHIWQFITVHLFNSQINNLLNWVWYSWNRWGNVKTIVGRTRDTRSWNTKNSCCRIYWHEGRNDGTVVAVQTENYWSRSWGRTWQIWNLCACCWFSNWKWLVCLFEGRHPKLLEVTKLYVTDWFV